jgi:hypothetical protein
MERYMLNGDDWEVFKVLEKNPFGLTKEEIAQKMGKPIEVVEKSLKLLEKICWVREFDGKFIPAH